MTAQQYEKNNESDAAKRTEELYQRALKYSKYYEGKIQVTPRVPITGLQDFSFWYTPGVAAVSRQLAKNKDDSFEYTSRWNTIAIMSDGTRVLGLGDIGPEGAMPVMEGKALIFKYLGGVDAIPLVLNTKNREEFLKVAKFLEPSFGGINLEDIASPKCFYLLENIREQLNITVWHDDQQGTAGATLAGLINAFKLTGKSPKESRVIIFGSGASNIATIRVLEVYGVPAKNMIVIDSKGILHADREDMDSLMLKNPWKYEVALKTNSEMITGPIEEAFKGADVLVAASKPGPGTIKKEWIAQMNNDAIVFSLANPVPEIYPEDAKRAGAKIVATGRSDFPNQVNNSLVFPGVFRGALDARARTVTDEMVVTAAETLAAHAEEKGIHEEYIIPTMEEWVVYPKVAAATASKAVSMGVARIKRSHDEFFEIANTIIKSTRTMIERLMKHGDIKPFPKEVP